MANYNKFSDEEDLRLIKGTVSVITLEPGPINVLPEAIIIEKYVDGEKVEGSEQYFATSDVSTAILDADLEPAVYISNEAESTYDTMIELAEMFEAANCNYDVYAAMLDEKLKADAEVLEEDDSEE